MGQVVALQSLLDTQRIWRGQGDAVSLAPQPTGHARLDQALPTGGWPAAALSEILLAGPGIGELHLLWPTLARLTGAAERVVLVGPPYVPFPAAWRAAGVDLRHLMLIEADAKQALWAAEQCLRSGSCGAVLCWPERADDRALRRLQVAAEAGQTLAFAYRPAEAASNPSPAALRLLLESQPVGVRVLKCRGGLAPATPIRLHA